MPRIGTGDTTATDTTHRLSEHQLVDSSKPEPSYDKNSKFHLIFGGLCLVIGGFAMSPLLNRGFVTYSDPAIYAGVVYTLMGCVLLYCGNDPSAAKLCGGLVASILVICTAVAATRLEIHIVTNTKILNDNMGTIMRNRLILLEIQALIVMHLVLIILHITEFVLGLCYILSFLNHYIIAFIVND